MKFKHLGILVLSLGISVLLNAQTMDKTWESTLQQAKGQTVYFNAWGGSETINDYIAWASQKVNERHGVKVVHVKTGAADVVSRVLAEKTANSDKGSVDLVWINGENFKSMKQNELLLNPWTQMLPNYQYVDTDNKPTTTSDFTVAVNNQEAPWGMAQLVFYYDSELLNTPPTSMTELLSVAKQNPGRVTYPALPNFFGTTFVKQALSEFIADASVLSLPVDESKFLMQTEKLWAFLDELHPVLWHEGKQFANDAPHMKQLVNSREIFIGLSFNPNDAANAVINGELPESIRSYVHEKGSIGNTHFVAIPYNAPSQAGAKVFADFLMSPLAQARKQDINIWGDPTVLAVNKLTENEQSLFESRVESEQLLSAQDLANVFLEPHASWVDAIEKEWIKRYSN
ncbi:ABC transporter substrate-binding protein [Marinicellulosiphila megalodicopiae]|uniref:ABC transporter substrate-binding protein n=1 Tax=Marinicellulosiphila megalodicopiae TaxID=2724896 RepID=UPI003BAE3F72